MIPPSPSLRLDLSAVILNMARLNIIAAWIYPRLALGEGFTYIQCTLSSQWFVTVRNHMLRSNDQTQTRNITRYTVLVSKQTLVQSPTQP